MASQDESFSFEALIHADRQRKKNEDLANEIFGRSKSKPNAPNAQKKPKERTPSLASRMGIQKRSSSSNTPTQKSGGFNPPSRPSSTTPSHRNNQNSTRTSRIAFELDSGTNTNVTLAPSRAKSFNDERNGASSTGFTIKGSAGPFTLLASNFAPGTTEADIEAALHTELFDETGNNCLQSCQIVASRPSVVAEMVFTEKSVADRIVSKFNNLKADGRILKVTLSKSGTDATNSARRSGSDRLRSDQAIAPTIEPVSAISDMNPTSMSIGGEGDMEVDDADNAVDYSASAPYDHDREAADRDRLNRDRDRDRDGFTGSRRGDDQRRDVDRPRDDRERRRDDHDRDRERDRDRDREREREPERDRDRDRERDRDRDRTEFEQRGSYDNRQPRAPPPAYGNGFNGPFQRGGYGGYGGRGAYGFGRGAYPPRGGYRGGYAR